MQLADDLVDWAMQLSNNYVLMVGVHEKETPYKDATLFRISTSFLRFMNYVTMQIIDNDKQYL